MGKQEFVRLLCGVTRSHAIGPLQHAIASESLVEICNLSPGRVIWFS